MGENSKIGWTDHTFNPWRGCTKVSAGCLNCYAEEQQTRYQGAKWGPGEVRIIAAESTWKNPVKWNKEAAAAGVRARVFCASLADVFEDREDLVAPRNRLFDLVEATPALDWLLLTKRPENMARLAPRWAYGWPANAWAMTTVEDQAAAGKRIPWLMEVPALVRGISVEPMLGPMDLTNLDLTEAHMALNLHGIRVVLNCLTGQVKGPDDMLPGAINWVICGGESGAEHRAFDLGWARDLRDQCAAAGVAFFMKQLGGHPDKKDQLEDLAEDLRVRQWPA